MCKAFTLIELLIVVAIIAILAAIAVPNFLEAQTRAKVARVKADMRTVTVAIQAYTVDNNEVPHRNVNNGLLDQGFLEFQPFNPAVPRWMWFFPPHMLTTPISYITRIPYDPFWSLAFRNYMRLANAPLIGAGLVSSWIIVAPLKGIPFPDLLPKLGLGDQPWARWPGGKFNWALMSTGPSLNIDANYHPQTFYYDPTNGTVSIGDIYYYSHVGFKGGSGN